MKLSVVLIFLAVLIGQFNFGIVGSIIIAAFLLAYFSWLNFIHNPKTGQKKILFILTAIVAHLYLILHLINLPIRIHLNQTDFRIAINISTIFLGMTMVMGCIEKWSQKTESRNEEDDLNS
ncbi:MAG: hypothetical protein GWO38_28060, partial [Phycisphaerae bacterium]|nr:hypothetical protein [Phycisphaerae bacterium]NIP55202.1 hypothetical protein [Phycisphaerae bacterium]NIX01575.1 hypothetical protein [Phycisphaerae bacterium]NIX31375.1 hypothetical protein [Phycisphaerae bacterium]